MLETPPPNTIVLQGYEETFRLALVDAVYCILKDGRFSLSIESKDDPPVGGAVFTFERASLEGPLAPGTVLSIPHSQDERDSFDEPSTHLYFIVHDDPRNCVLEVVAATPDSITVVGRFRWNQRYVPDLGQMEYAEAVFHAECRLGTQEDLRILM